MKSLGGKVRLCLSKTFFFPDGKTKILAYKVGRTFLAYFEFETEGLIKERRCWSLTFRLIKPKSWFLLSVCGLDESPSWGWNANHLVGGRWGGTHFFVKKNTNALFAVIHRLFDFVYIYGCCSLHHVASCSQLLLQEAGEQVWIVWFCENEPMGKKNPTFNSLSLAEASLQWKR